MRGLEEEKREEEENAGEPFLRNKGSPAPLPKNSQIVASWDGRLR